MHATEMMKPTILQLPFATWNPTRGCWETNQADLFGRTEPYSGIWPAHRITGTGCSSPPIAKTLFQTPLASGSSCGGETLDQVRARRGTIERAHWWQQVAERQW